jgi:chemotaxis protein histidine kinase CheA
MPTYTKLSPADFRKKLKNGEYESLTGARRAIGKMQEWTESERDRARASAAKHFGEETPAPKKKTKKKAAKKAAKKVAKKAAAKTAKKAAKKAAKKPAGPGPGRGRKKKAAKKTKAAAPKKPAPKKQPKAGKQPGVDVDARIESTRNAVQAYAEAVDVLKKCQTEQTSVEAGLKSAAAGVTQLIERMQTDIVQPLTDAERRGAELFSRAAPTAVVPGTTPPVVPGNGSGQVAQAPQPPTAAPTPPAVTPPPVVPPTTSG